MSKIDKVKIEKAVKSILEALGDDPYREGLIDTPCCMTARGIKKPGTKTKTACLSGKFKTNAELRQEFYSLIK